MVAYRKALTVIIVVIVLIASGIGATVFTRPGQAGKEIVFNRVVPDFPVTFSHAAHVGDHNLPCADCHTALFPMQKSDIAIMMADFKDGKVCGACHSGGKAFGPANNCTLCHELATDEAIDYQHYLVFYHASHVKKHGYECDACHDSLFKPRVSEPQMNSDELQKHFDQGRLCGACHNGLTAFEHYVY